MVVDGSLPGLIFWMWAPSAPLPACVGHLLYPPFQGGWLGTTFVYEFPGFSSVLHSILECRQELKVRQRCDDAGCDSVPLGKLVPRVVLPEDWWADLTVPNGRVSALFTGISCWPSQSTIAVGQQPCYTPFYTCTLSIYNSCCGSAWRKSIYPCMNLH